MSLFPSWAVCATFTQVTDLMTALNVSDPNWDAFTAQAGDPGQDIRLLAALPRVALTAGCNFSILADGSNYTPMQPTQIGLMWRLARRVTAARAGIPETEFVDVDPWAEATNSSAPMGDTVAAVPPSLKEKVLKMSSLIDQQDESELQLVSNAIINKWLQAYMTLMGSMPDRSEEPTPAQLSALHKRVSVNDNAPYVDMSIWVPFERRMSKVQKCRTYHPLGDGSFLVRDLPGPSTHQGWLASWRVFKCAALMQEIVSLAALQNYERHIEKLVMQWPGAWGLIYEADDRARAEQLERLRRQLIAEASVGRQVPTSWDPARPWSCIFQQVVEDGPYWQECVHIPAAAWIAAGSKGKPIIASEAAILKMMPGGKDLEGGQQLEPEDGERKRRSQANRDKRLAKRKRIQEELHEFRKMKGGGKGDAGSKGKGKGKTKDQTGKPLCFAWASGGQPCGHLAPGAECISSIKRIHKCRICLSPSHQDKDCTSG